MATRDQVMAELAALGTEQTRKTYRRHGVAEPLSAREPRAGG